MAPTPSKQIQTPVTHLRTPQSKQRLHLKSPNPNPNPNQISGEHPVEVVGRIRDFPDRKEKPISVLQVNPERQTCRVRADIGYRDFTLDGVSLSEEEDLDAFYNKFIQTRIKGVKLGAKCTIMMYGPTGSGKSHTMFGCSKQPGIVYRSLKDILGEREDDGERAMFVHVTVLEIYNEEIYDLLSTNGAGAGGFTLGWPKGASASKVRLEVMGKKAKNATFISGTEAGKISKEIQKVEKRRIVKSTLCNERSSRSHCMIILDVPTVGGRLMLVDMAGSENIEQAGQTGFEAKMQTAKINQGNVSLKRVVESIANGDSHVPFRDSKLTMLLQDSFEDDKSKILMILCASPDPKEIHKTISTLEYGAKAKCIVRGPHTPIKDKTDSSAVLLGSRITAMDQFICKLQTENKLREKECNEARKELSKKEQEVAALRAKVESVEVKGFGVSEEEINLKVNEQTQILKLELEKKLEECQRMANEFVELERRRMEERIEQQQQEVEMLRRRLEEIESELCRSRDNQPGSRDSMEGSRFSKRLQGIYGDEDPGMVKSMDLDMGDQETFSQDVKQAPMLFAHQSDHGLGSNSNDHDVFATKYSPLSTVFEEEETEEEDEQKNGRYDDQEIVQKEIIEEKRMVGESLSVAMNHDEVCSKNPSKENEQDALLWSVRNEGENGKESASCRRVRIQNIFTLCGNHRELTQHIGTPMPGAKRRSENVDPHTPPSAKEKYNPCSDGSEIEVYVKWEASKENPAKFITTLKVAREASLADVRKLIEIYLGADKQAFTFLILGDPSGGPVQKDKEGSVEATKLPVCNNQVKGYLACLRPKGNKIQCPTPTQTPLSSVENKMALTPIPTLSPQMLYSTPLVTKYI